MKKSRVKKLLSRFLTLIITVSMMLPFSTTAFAAGILTEYENINTTNIYNNDSYTGAQLIFSSSLLNKTYSYVQGSFYGEDDLSDCYSFGLGKSDGSNGRIAIKLEGIPFSDNYDLQLLNQNGDVITSSNRAGNSNEIVRTPAINAYTNYFIRIVPTGVQNYASSLYRIVFDTNIVAVTKTSSLTPSTLNSTNNTWSPNAYVNNSSLPVDSIITSAVVQASKSTTNNTYNNQLRVQIGSGNSEIVTWKSGEIPLPGLINQNASGYWYTGFRASELAILIGGKLTYLGIVSMNTFKLTIKYEYDRFLNY